MKETLQITLLLFISMQFTVFLNAQNILPTKNPDPSLITEFLFDNDSVIPPDSIVTLNGERIWGYVDDSGLNNIEATLRGRSALYEEGYVGKAIRLIDSAHVFAGKSEDALNVDKFTTMAWIKPLTYGADDKRSEIVERTNIYWMNFRTDTWIFRAGVFDANDKWWYIDGDYRMPLNEWTHTAFSYDGDTMKIYYNGRLSGCYSAGNKGITSAVNRILSIGSREPKTNEDPAAYFDGLIDEFRVFNKVLTQSEIVKYMNINNVTATAPTAPSELKSDSINKGKIALSWTDNSDNEHEFVIYSCKNNEKWTQIGNTPMNTPNYMCTGLEPNTEYSFKVVAIGKTGMSLFSNEITFTSPSTDFPAPVSQYSFENNFNDSYGSMHGYGMYQADFENNVLPRNFDDPNFVEGVKGKALNLKNYNAYVAIPYSIYNSFTISLWIKTNSKGSSGNDWYKGAGLVDGEIGGAANDFGVALLDNKFALGIGNDDVTITSDASVTDNEWHSLIATFNSENMEMKTYVDYELQSQQGVAKSTKPRSAAGKLFIGKGRTNNNYYNGLIDEISIYNVSLTKEQIKQLGSEPNETYQITFNITDNNGFIDGAKITFNNESKLTDLSGKAIFNGINSGSVLNYTITKDGYAEATSSVTVDANKTVDIVMVPTHINETKTFAKLYPNPANNFVSLNTNLQNDVKVIISDLHGKTTLNKIYTANNAVNIDISDLKSGIYIVKIESITITLVEKLIVK